MLPAACHQVLEEVAEETPHRHARQLHRAHHTHIDCHHLRALVTAVVLDHFPHRRERSHLTLRKVVVYGIAAVLAVKEKAVLKWSKWLSTCSIWADLFFPYLFIDVIRYQTFVCYSTCDRITSGGTPISVMAEILWPPLAFSEWPQ